MSLMDFTEIEAEVAKLFGGQLPNEAMEHLFRRLRVMEGQLNSIDKRISNIVNIKDTMR